MDIDRENTLSNCTQTHIHTYSTQECVGSSMILTKDSGGCRWNGEPPVNVFFCFFWLWYGPVESDSLH